MLSIPSQTPALLAVAVAVILTGSHCPALAQAPATSTSPAQRNWKDRSEWEAWEAINKETDPAKKLGLLESWSRNYPNSEFADDRQAVYLLVYGQLNRPADVLATAGEILAREPDNLSALSGALTALFTIQTPSSGQLALAEKVAHQIIANLDTLFAAGKKPAGTSDSDWVAARRNMQLYARNALGFIALERKEYERAEEDLVKSLETDPGQAQVSYWLSTALLAQRKPDRYSAALYHMARAAVLDGAGSFNAGSRKQVRENFETTYRKWHGSDDGAQAVLDRARSGAMPPADFNIASKAEIEKAREEDLKRSNPQLALWKSIKVTLTGSGGPDYFEAHMKDASLPEFTGKLIEARPDTRPTELVVAIEDGVTPDATLVLDQPLPGKTEPGAELGFQGVPKQYAADPFMVTFAVARTRISGWKGGPIPAKAKPKAKAKRTS